MNINININTSKIQLETDRLILRAFCDDDLADFYEYARVPGVGEMAGWPHHENIETSKRILQSFMTENEVFALVLKENGKVIGSLGLHYSWANDDPKYSAMKSKEIGYVLSRDYWGHGLIPEAVSSVISMCFHEYGCEILTYGHFTTNNQSRRVIEKSGFRFEKQSSFHSKQLDTDFEDMKYVLLRSEWPGAACFIRPVQTNDATALAKILCGSWQSAYKNILNPEEMERNTNLAARTTMFDKIIKSGIGSTRIAFSNGEPCGIISFGKSRDAGLSDYAEIIAIYSAEDYWGKGVGTQLMEIALSEIKNQGYSSVLLWTFETNSRARRFYEKHGFALDGAVKDSGFGNAKEVRYRRKL